MREIRETRAIGDVRAYTTETREREAPRRVRRLAAQEVQDLRDLWTGIGFALGVRSHHGALENRLLLAPPREREVADPILDELDRQGGRCCEGLLLRLVAFDKYGGLRGHGVPAEVKRALKKLVRDGVLERRPTLAPDVPTPTRWDESIGEWVQNRTYAEQRRVDDWTGFEIGRAKTPRLALKVVPMTREERWAKQDEALERECHLMYGKETPTTQSYEPPENARRSGANRAHRALSRISDRQAEILRTVFGQRHESEMSELDAVRALVGGSTEAAGAAINDACKAYREARNR